MLGLQSWGFLVASNRLYVFALLVLLTAGAAHAFLQLAAIPRFAASLAASPTAQKLATHTVGTLAAYLVIDAGVQSYYRLNQNDNSDLPAGWADRNTPPATSPIVFDSTTGYAFVGGNRLYNITTTSAESARDQWIAWRNAQNLDFFRAVGSCTWVSAQQANCGVEWRSLTCVEPCANWYSDTLSFVLDTTVTTGCPVGYSYDGATATCVLTDSSAVRYSADGTCEWIRDSQGNFLPNSRDEDCDGVTPPTASSDTLVTTDAQGRTTSETRITDNVDGTRTITQTEYDYAAGTTTTTTAVIDDAGTIQQILTTTTEGTAEAPSTSVVVNFPNDYARQGTLESIDSKLAPPPPLTGTAAPDLYTPTSLTFDSVLANFRARAENTAVYTAVSNFFLTDVQGQCPQWEIPSVMDMPAIPITAQCSSMMENIWPFISAVIIATAGFVAFRWAFL